MTPTTPTGEAGRTERCTPTSTLRSLQPIAGLEDTLTPGLALSRDETVVYFNHLGQKGLRRARRADRDAPFGAAEPLLADDYLFNPHLSADGTKLYVDRGAGDTLRVAKADVTHEGLLSVLADVPGTTKLAEAHVSESDGALFAAAVFDGTIGTVTDRGYQVVPELAVRKDTGGRSRHPVVSKDGKSIYFQVTYDEGGSSVVALYFATRKSTSSREAFSAPQRVTGLPDGSSIPGWLSEDGCRLYVTTRVATGWKAYVASTQ